MADVLKEGEKLVRLNKQPWIVRNDGTRFWIRPAEGNPARGDSEYYCMVYEDDVPPAREFAELLFASLPKYANYHGRWKNVSPHMARIALAMRSTMCTAGVGRALGMRREAICIAIRATEALTGQQLFSRSRGTRSRWGVVDSPDAQAVWRVLEEMVAAYEQPAPSGSDTCPHGHSRGMCGNPACIPFNAGIEKEVAHV